jgi:hypothetical protein
MRSTDETPFIADPVRPGEQWFCYWKTSAALWEAKILEFAQHEVVFIPVYWGFHAENNGIWDFGVFNPERDLLRLSSLMTRHGRRFCWLLPVTPAPFLPNGGVPISAARTLALSPQGMHLASLDPEGALHKMYSFFEPKVFQIYASFVQEFGKMLGENQLKTPVWGAEFFYLENHQTISFLQDHSLAFEQGFSRYLKKKFPEGLDLHLASDEGKLKKTFQSDLQSLFQSIASEGLAPFWQGVQSITMFGAGPQDTIERSLDSGKSQAKYFQELFGNYVGQRWFSTSLLTTKEKKDLLSKCLDNHFDNEEIEHRFHYLSEKAELGVDFRPFCLVDVFDLSDQGVFEKNGLKPFLQEHYRWMYFLHENIEFTPEWIDSSYHRIKFFHAKGMDRTMFAQMLKLFMMGQKVIFDRSELSEELDKRLQIFFLENNLKPQFVNFITPVDFSELGEGRFITFEGEKLQNMKDQESFWFHMFKFLSLNHPHVHADQDIFSLWRIRATSPHELNYLDVRRVNFYNPTSYKKTVLVQTQKKFAFMKVIDPSNASARTNSEGVEVELLPNGRLALDFGHYEEKQ